MKKTSITLDPETRKMIDDYCAQTGKKFSDSLREFIRQGCEQYKVEKEIGFKSSIGQGGLMVNEKRAIRASIETLFLVREIFNNPSQSELISNKVDEIMKQGWFYDNE